MASSAVKRQVRRAVRGAARTRDAVLAPPAGTVVLLYHRVGGRTPVPVDLPRAVFADQMAEIAERAVTLDEAISKDRPGDHRRVVVTFDDGTADVIDEALPILVEHKVPALLYVATRFIEDGADFPDDGTPASWSALRDGVSSGFLQLGSHTHNHALLDRLPDRQVADELDRSIELIGEHTGATADHFAYPKALDGTSFARAAVAGRFRSAALAGTRTNPNGRLDPQRLYRSPIQQADTGDGFRRKLAGGLRFEDDLRQVINRVRYRGATA